MSSLLNLVMRSLRKLRGQSSEDYLEVLRQSEHIHIRNPWQAVEIVSDSHGCAASKQITDQRFLCTEAPKLPLPGCTSSRCSCRYKHFSDRRQGARRADELDVFSMLLSGPETDRRARRGRRSTDSQVSG